MFFGREDYLDRFKSLWAKKVSSLVICRGRRRIGKSTLIKVFAERSGGCYLKLEGLAPDEYMTNAKQLESFRDQLSSQTGRDVPKLTDWAQAFRELNAALPGSGRKIILLDEVSWMGGYDKTFPAKLKIAWDNLFHEHPDLILFVCGSVSTWINKNILKSKGFVGRVSLDVVVDELSLPECLRFWGARAKRVNIREILDVLSVTGGVPRYLEEIDPSLPADENIRRLCFSADGYLFREFNELFNDIVSRTASTKRKVLETLAEGAQSGSELASKIAVARNGRLSDLLDELETAGFVAKEEGVNPATGKRGRVDRYRLRDNYTRFFLRYVSPRLPEIKAGTFRFHSVSLLPEWNVIMGLQFENLVLNNLPTVLKALGLADRLIISAEPYRCMRSGRGGVQVDLLVQTENLAYVIEIKRKAELGVDVAYEIAQKVTRLPARKGLSIRTALVYDGQLSPALAANDQIDLFVSSRQLLEQS